MRRRILLTVGLAALSAPGLAQPEPGNLAVTIYNQNLALVQDTRQLNLPAGRSRQEFPNVSGQISPETVTLTVRMKDRLGNPANLGSSVDVVNIDSIKAQRAFNNGNLALQRNGTFDPSFNAAIAALGGVEAK